MRFLIALALSALALLASCSSMAHPDGKAFTHRYAIESEDLGDRTIKVNLLFASGDSRETTYVITADGSSMDSSTIITGIETQSRLTKVDDQTGP